MDEQLAGERAQRVAEMRDDPAIDLVLDANAIGGLLAGLFGADVTGRAGECAHCHTVSTVATMRAYTRGPGIVVRCPACTDVVLRVVETPTEMYVDLAGMRTIRLGRI